MRSIQELRTGYAICLRKDYAKCVAGTDSITGEPELAKVVEKTKTPKPTVPFPDNQLEAADFQNAIVAKLATAHYLGKPLGGLPDDDRCFIAQVLEKTLNKQQIMATVKAHFARKRQKRR